MKNVVKLLRFFYPWDLEQAIVDFVDYTNEERYPESLDNLMPADVNLDRADEGKDKREEITQKTMKQRR